MRSRHYSSNRIKVKKTAAKTDQTSVSVTVEIECDAFYYFFFSFSLKAKISFLSKLYLVLQHKGGSGTPGTLLWLFHWSVTINNSLIIIDRNTPNLLLDVQNTHHKLIHTPNYMQKYPGCDTVWSPLWKFLAMPLMFCWYYIFDRVMQNWKFQISVERRKVLNNCLEGVRFCVPLYTKR